MQKFGMQEIEKQNKECQKDGISKKQMWPAESPCDSYSLRSYVNLLGQYIQLTWPIVS